MKTNLWLIACGALTTVPLGNIHLNFKEPIITSDQESSTKGYDVYSLNTGSCELVIAPTTIR